MLRDVVKMREKFVVCGPHGEIIESAIGEAEDAVRKFDQDTNEGARFLFPSPQALWEDGDNGWNTWMVPKGKFSGTWPKRYSSYVWQTHKCRPPESLIAKLGEILSRFANCEQTHICDITDECDWDAGDFGESTGSCWWGEYSHARTGLFANGGMALRFFEQNGHGCGRCWLWEDDDGKLFIFNAYHRHELTLYQMACLLATHLGISYKRCRIDVPDAYINGNYGFVLAPVDVLGHFDHDHRFDIEFCDEPEDMRECDDCGRQFPEDDDWWQTANGDTVCRRCYEDHYFSCERCSEVFHWDDRNEGTDGNGYCETCFGKLFTNCESCGIAIRLEDAIEFNGDSYCDKCASMECKKCGERTDFDLTDGLCPDCAKEEAKNDSKS